MWKWIRAIAAVSIIASAGAALAIEIDVTQVASHGGPANAIPDDGLDDSAAFAFAGANASDIAIAPPGTYHIDSNTFMYGVYRPLRGAVVVPRAATFELRGPIEAGAWQIFDEITGPGTCTSTTVRPNGNLVLFAEWWGAVGDDGVDDTAALRRALEEASRSGDLRGLPTVYDVCGLVVTASHMNWIGTGQGSGGDPSSSVSPTGETIYRATSGCNQDVITLGDTSVMPAAFSTGLVMRSIGIDGNRDNNSAGNCLTIDQTLWLSLEQVSTHRCAEDGIHGVTLNQALFHQVRSTTNDGDGVHLSGGADNVLMLNLDSEDNLGAGLRISGGGTGGPATVLSPYFEGNDVAFANEGTSCVILIGARESQSATAGVEIASSATCTTIDTMSFASATPRLLVHAGASGTMLRNIEDGVIDDQAAPNRTAKFTRLPDGTWRLSGVWYQFGSVPAGVPTWLLGAAFGVLGFWLMRRRAG